MRGCPGRPPRCRCARRVSTRTPWISSEGGPYSSNAHGTQDRPCGAGGARHVDFGGHPAVVVGVVPDPAGDELGSLGDAVVALGAGWVLCSQSEVSDRLADLAGSDSSAVPVAVCSFG